MAAAPSDNPRDETGCPRNEPSRHSCISIRELSLSYRTGLFGRQRLAALTDLSFEVARGSLLAIVGANGSGKSSLLRCMLGLEEADRGHVHVLGQKAGSRALRGKIGVVLEGRLPLGRLSGQEYLQLAGCIGGLQAAEARARAQQILARLGLSKAARRAHGDWSTGMERRLAFAEALVLQPELLLLDEAGSGLDPLALEVLREELIAQRARGGSAVVASHVLDAIGPEIFDSILVLSGGRIVASGNAESLLQEKPGAQGCQRLRLAELLGRCTEPDALPQPEPAQPKRAQPQAGQD